MWSRFLGEEGMKSYTNEELLDYKRALWDYKESILLYIEAYIKEKKTVLKTLKERLDKLEYAELEAEGARLDSDVYYWASQTWLH